MKNRIIKRKYYVWALAFLFAIALSPYIFFLGKPVHVSIDDVSVFERLSEGDYENVFDEPFLKKFQTLHRRTGAKFTLYVYETSVGDVPDYYWAQLRANSDWLKIGFHATSAEEPITQCDNEFIASYDRLDSILSYNAPQNKTKTLRLHYWKATPAEVDHLRKKDIHCLLCADRDVISYSLSAGDDSLLQATELLYKDGLYYKKTDFRVDNTNVFTALYYNATDKDIVFFTHEWSFSDNSGINYKVSTLLIFLKIYGARFIV